MNQKQIELGESNLKRVRDFMASHLCATQAECAEALQLSPMAVNRHVATIRAEWSRPKRCDATSDMFGAQP